MRSVMDKMSDAKVHFRQCQAYMLSVSSSIIQRIQQHDLDMAQILEEGEDHEDTFALIPKMQKKEDFSQWLLSVALRMNQVMNQERDNTMKQVIQEAKEYIMDNYQDPDLSVEKICRHLHAKGSLLPFLLLRGCGQRNL